MLESIRTLIDVPTGAALLVRQEDRRAARSRRLLLKEARLRAKSCVLEAQKEATLIQATAFQEGYSRGVLQVASDLGALLLESRAVATALQANLFNAARTLLGDVLKDEQLLNLLLQRFQGEWVAQRQELLQVLLPLRCKSEKIKLKSTLNSMGFASVDIQCHAQERYLFRLADQVIELDIGAAQERLSFRLIAQLEQLPDDVRQLDGASRDLLAKWAAGLCGSPS